MHSYLCKQELVWKMSMVATMQMMLMRLALVTFSTSTINDCKKLPTLTKAHQASISLWVLGTSVVHDYAHQGELMSKIVKSTEEMLLIYCNFIREIRDPDDGLVSLRQPLFRCLRSVMINNHLKNKFHRMIQGWRWSSRWTSLGLGPRDSQRLDIISNSK